MILQRINNRSGFTLIELVILIAIIGVLLSVIIPFVIGSLDKLKDGNNEVEVVDQTEDIQPEQQTPAKEVQEKL